MLSNPPPPATPAWNLTPTPLEDAENNDPLGIWSDGETMWVTDDGDDKLYAYDLATKERAEDKEFTLKTSPTDGKFPQSLWSDGATMWVAHFLWSGTESKIFAYNLSTKSRDSSKDFDTLLAAENKNPVGLWSDGTTMWVADSQDGKLYAYNQPLSANNKLKRLELSGVYSGNQFFSKHFSSGETN